MRKLTAIIFLFIFSTTLFANSVQLHYCQGELTDITIIGEADCICPVEEAPHDHHTEQENKCCDEQEEETPNPALQVKGDNDDCCTTKVIQASASDYISSNLNEHSNIDTAPIHANRFDIQNSLTRHHSVVQPYYLPPLERDIIVWFQSFRI